MNLGHEGKLQERKEFILLTNQSRTSHKNNLPSQAVVQASPALQIGNNDADSENSFVHWCESLWVDVKYHYVITCGPQVSSICTVSNVIFLPSAAERKLKKQYALVIITVKPFRLYHISSSIQFTYLTKCITDVWYCIVLIFYLMWPGTWKQPRCPSTDEWIKKLWYIYTMEYYSGIKRNTFETVLMRWTNQEPIIKVK